MKGPFPFLRILGSLRFAAVLLVLLLAAMACATIFESMHGTEQALQRYYTSWWFELLLWLVAINVLAAVLIRYPFSKALFGFVLTHLSILIILAGVLVSRHWGVDGRVGIREGQTVESFDDLHRSELAIRNRLDQNKASVDLDGTGVDRLARIDQVKAAQLRLGDLRVDVLRYLPDSESRQEVVNDNPHPHPAVQVSLSPSGHDDPSWVFVNQSTRLGSQSASFRQVDHAELAALLTEPSPSEHESRGTIRVEHNEATFEFAVEACTDQPVSVGQTGYTLRILRYLPHAVVGPDKQVTSASDRPMNPAVEVEIVGPKGSEKRFAFARFPDFGAMHGGGDAESLKVTFLASSQAAPSASIEILSAPEGQLYGRFSKGSDQTVTRELNIGEAVETPWPGQKFAVLHRYDHARFSWSVEPVTPVRKERTPAVLVKLSTPENSNQMWLQKNAPRAVTVDRIPYEIAYRSKKHPLGFALTLNEFRVGFYPGGSRPRSFESQVAILDPHTGRSQHRVISMNNPAKHAGYSLYQSSYHQEGGVNWSFLSVSRDPGKTIVFAGYILLMMGMFIVLVTRMRAKQRMARSAQPEDIAPPRTAKAGSDQPSRSVRVTAEERSAG